MIRFSLSVFILVQWCARANSSINSKKFEVCLNTFPIVIKSKSNKSILNQTECSEYFLFKIKLVLISLSHG